MPVDALMDDSGLLFNISLPPGATAGTYPHAEKTYTPDAPGLQSREGSSLAESGLDHDKTHSLLAIFKPVCIGGYASVRAKNLPGPSRLLQIAFFSCKYVGALYVVV